MLCLCKHLNKGDALVNVLTAHWCALDSINNNHWFMVGVRLLSFGCKLEFSKHKRRVRVYMKW